MSNHPNYQFGEIQEVANKAFICDVIENNKKYVLRLTKTIFQIFLEGNKIAEFSCQNFPFESESIKKFYIHVKEKGLMHL